HACLAAAEAAERETGKAVAVFNARFVKPLPETQILAHTRGVEKILIVEENARMGGFSSAVLECLADNDALQGKKIVRLGLPDAFIEHGPQKSLRALAGLDQQGVKASLLALLAQPAA
ncbi:MAG: 1-deoxy-D-xylulose-5-phosphate synthase, partial [Desulfovibrionaceae bacterium]|nr:1-deoxy-D-xylulose-5-phosphate synthase [Desulfovibrionaceae bacterium]